MVTNNNNKKRHNSIQLHPSTSIPSWDSSESKGEDSVGSKENVSCTLAPAVGWAHLHESCLVAPGITNNEMAAWAWQTPLSLEVFTAYVDTELKGMV